MGDLPVYSTLEVAIRFRQELVSKFHAVMLETRLDASDLLSMLLDLYYRSKRTAGKRKPGRPPKFHKRGVSKEPSKWFGGGRSLKSKRLKPSRDDDESRAKVVDTPSSVTSLESFSKLTLLERPCSDEVQSGLTTAPHPAILPNPSDRRSSRKPSSPKRKIAESDNSTDAPDVAVGENCLSTPPTPKRRRKNKPQKLVRLSSGEDNSCSDPENEHELTESKIVADPKLKQTQVPKERKSKVNAKAVIDQVTKTILGIEKPKDQDEKEKGEKELGADTLSEIVHFQDENIPLEEKDGHEEPDPSTPHDVWQPTTKPGRPKGSVTSKTGKPSFDCTLCQASFHRPAHLRRHMQGVHKKDSAYSCRGCGKACSSQLTKKYHESLGCKLLKLPYRCPVCTMGFDIQADMDDHKCSKDPTKPCICFSCDYKTGSARDLEQHLRVHTGEKCFKCDQCDFATAWRKNLKEHMFKHTGLKPYVCDVCGFATNDRHNLRSHRTTHSAEKAFMCEICGDKFRETRFLKAHQIVHTNLKPYKCSQCNYSAKFKSSLRSHMLGHTGLKKFVCEQCGQCFRTKNHLQNHQNNLHLYHDMRYGCKHCDFTASNSQSINSHMRKHTKKPRKQKQSKKKAPDVDGLNCPVEGEQDNPKVKKEINIYRFEATHQDGGHSNVSSTGFDGLQSEGRQLEATMTTINTQDLQELRENHQDGSVLTQFPVTSGEVLAVLPCFHNDASAPHQDGVTSIMTSDLTRPQYEELLYNSNASQAETISAMMTLIRDLRPR